MVGGESARGGEVMVEKRPNAGRISYVNDDGHAQARDTIIRVLQNTPIWDFTHAVQL